jgi:hypothetical protein
MRRTSSISGNITARRLFALVIAAPIFTVCGSGIHAQSLPEERSPKVNLTVEQKHVVKELVKDLKIQSVTTDAPTAIGDKVPERVVAQPIPVEVGQRVPQLRLHAFYVKGDNIVLVDPKNRMIADVIN